MSKKIETMDRNNSIYGKILLWTPILLLLAGCAGMDENPVNADPQDKGESQEKVSSSLKVSIMSAPADAAADDSNLDVNIVDFMAYVFDSSTGLLDITFGMDKDRNPLGAAENITGTAGGGIEVSTSAVTVGRKDILVLANLGTYSGRQGVTGLEYPAVTEGLTSIFDMNGKVCTVGSMKDLIYDGATAMPLTTDGTVSVTVQPNVANTAAVPLVRPLARYSLAVDPRQSEKENSIYGYIDGAAVYKPVSMPKSFYLLPEIKNGDWTVPDYGTAFAQDRYMSSQYYSDDTAAGSEIHYLTENRAQDNVAGNTSAVMVKTTFRPRELYDQNGQNKIIWDGQKYSYASTGGIYDGGQNGELPAAAPDTGGEAKPTFWRLVSNDGTSWGVIYFYQKPADTYYDTANWTAVPYYGRVCYYRINFRDPSQTDEYSVQRNRWFNVNIVSCSGAGFDTEDGAISRDPSDPAQETTVGVTFTVSDWKNDNEIPDIEL